MEKEKRWFASRVRVSIVVMLVLMLFAGLVFATNAAAQEAEEPAREEQVLTAERAGVQKFGLIAAAIAFGLGAIGAGIAIANVGAAAMGTIGEKPELASQALIFIALAEGLVVFGFITALMILGKV
jgi:V/A-type H+-transporting ATPase subunit K